MDRSIDIFCIRFSYFVRVLLEKKSFVSGCNLFYPGGRHIFSKMRPALCNLFFDEFSSS